LTRAYRTALLSRVREAVENERFEKSGITEYEEGRDEAIDDIIARLDAIAKEGA
jgi:hypothetical protein